MPTRFCYFLLALILCSTFNCADYPAPPRAHSLDYLEFHDPGGWLLRIDGDGGGRLRCRAHPQRTVHYLPATFPLHHLKQRFKNCGPTPQISSPNCLRAVYYQSDKNLTSVCACPETAWTKQYFELAFKEIKRSPAEIRDRRIIKRHWLQEPPLAGI